MLRRRELLLGMGVAALGACAPRLREPAAPTASVTVPQGAAARWPPFAAGVTIDAAAAVNLVWPEDMDAAVVAGQIARELAAARASGLSAVVTTVAPSGRFWLDESSSRPTAR